MREPPIDRIRLQRAVEAHYCIAPDRLDFVPIGYVAACYSVVCDARPAHFLKLWPDTPLGRSSASQLRATLPLLRALGTRLTTARVPEPRLTIDGSLSADFEGTPFVVFPHFSGQSPGDGMRVDRAAHWADVAGVLAELHGATATLPHGALPVDDFAIPFEAELPAALAATSADPATREAEHARVLDELARLRRFQAGARSTGPAPAVVCHTDLGHDNVFVDEAGLVVLDWDDAVVAPPEHDLKIAVHETDLTTFVAAYLRAGGVDDLHPDRFAFYLLRRHLADMTTRLHRLLHDQVDLAKSARAATRIIRWDIDRCARLDEAVATFEKAVRSA